MVRKYKLYHNNLWIPKNPNELNFFKSLDFFKELDVCPQKKNKYNLGFIKDSTVYMVYNTKKHTLIVENITLNKFFDNSYFCNKYKINNYDIIKFIMNTFYKIDFNYVDWNLLNRFNVNDFIC